MEDFLILDILFLLLFFKSNFSLYLVFIPSGFFFLLCVYNHCIISLIVWLHNRHLLWHIAILFFFMYIYFTAYWGAHVEILLSVTIEDWSFGAGSSAHSYLQVAWNNGDEDPQMLPMVTHFAVLASKVKKKIIY